MTKSKSLNKLLKKIIRFLLGLFLLIFILLEITYLLLTSSGFLTNYLLPEVSQRTNLKITASHFKLRPFYGLNASDLRVVSPGKWTASANNLSIGYIFKDLFNNSFNLKKLKAKNLQFDYPNVAQAAIDLDINGIYLFSDGHLETDLEASINSIQLSSSPNLRLNQPTKLKLAANFTNNLITAKTIISNLDLEDPTLLAIRGSLELHSDYLIGNSKAKGQFQTSLNHLSLSDLPKLVLTQGSSLSTDFKFLDNQLNLTKLTSELNTQENEVIKISGKANSNFLQNSHTATLDLNSKKIELAKILALFGNPKSSKAPKPKAEIKGEPLTLAINYAINTDEFIYAGQKLNQPKLIGHYNQPKDSKIDLAGKLSYDFELTANELVAGGLSFNKPISRGFGTNQALKIQQLDLSQGLNAQLTSNGKLSFADQKYSLNLDLNNFDLGSALPSLCGETCKVIKGKIHQTKLDLSGKGFTGDELNQSLIGTIQMTGEDISLPAKIQDIFPINIIFLPYKIVSTISSLTIAKILPESLLGQSSNADEALSESGRIKIKKFDLNVLANTDSYKLKEADFSMGIVPSANFSGEIAKDKDLKLEMGLWLAGIQIRVPVGGSTSLPIPRLDKLPYTLTKGLGLSVLDLIPDFKDNKEDTLETTEDIIDSNQESDKENSKDPLKDEEEDNGWFWF